MVLMVLMVLPTFYESFEEQYTYIYETKMQTVFIDTLIILI